VQKIRVLRLLLFFFSRDNCPGSGLVGAEVLADELVHGFRVHGFDLFFLDFEVVIGEAVEDV
jgi:hypothetical protein